MPGVLVVLPTTAGTILLPALVLIIGILACAVRGIYRAIPGASAAIAYSGALRISGSIESGVCIHLMTIHREEFEHVRLVPPD
jgi:hypothetical protein